MCLAELSLIIFGLVGLGFVCLGCVWLCLVGLGLIGLGCVWLCWVGLGWA